MDRTMQFTEFMKSRLALNDIATRLETAYSLVENENLSELRGVKLQIEREGKKVEDLFITNWPGMSSPKSRMFFNNVCRALSTLMPIRYLEVGTWAGSTLLSFIINQYNIEYVSAVDNFSQFQSDFDVKKLLRRGLNTLVHGDVVETFGDNYEMNLKDGNFKLQFLESHCFDLDTSRLFGKYNVYFFDGPHAYEDTKKGFTYYNHCLDDIFIVLIDDWNRDYIQKAWWDVKEELGYTVLWDKQIVGKGGSKVDDNWRNDWWDGFYVGLIKKGDDENKK